MHWQWGCPPTLSLKDNSRDDKRCGLGSWSSLIRLGAGSMMAAVDGQPRSDVEYMNTLLRISFVPKFRRMNSREDQLNKREDRQNCP